MDMKFLRVLIVIFGLAVFANGQNVEKTFALSGTVFDPAKVGVPKTEIIAVNKNGREFQIISDANGIYKISIPFGNYTITFQKDGFKKSIYTDFENQSVYENKLDVILEITNCCDCDGFILPGEGSDKRKLKEDYFSNSQQQKKENVSGIVTDNMGAIFPFLAINFTDENGKITKITSDDKGEYKIKLTPGIYLISAEIILNSALWKNKETKIEIKNLEEKKINFEMYCADKDKCPAVITYYCG